ncbi:hypothetical protein L6164_035956 [Bauhinia variegata]|uniref:Uncharacterized protein n=1 Tax=Bauhinia variegata TaxID=167791 RepID=A0ACB9KFJ8_BAUVA|nr:hypothetical protein L6164_035956 [Bauhinia variegata]
MDCKTHNPQPQTLSPSSSRRRRGGDCNSPEFEFWMVRNPSFPQPNLLSADELFVDGVLLPLQLVSTQNKGDPPDQALQPEPEPPNSDLPVVEPESEPGPGPESSPAITSSDATPSASKRWKDIFKKGDKKSAESNNNNGNPGEKDKEKSKKKERKAGSGGSSASAELNINIWPFTRSRSAGNAGSRPKLFPGAPASRKVNSAPCSRSNSAGESKSRKWPSSPGRTGVHLGRSSPVWQVRRGGSASKNTEPVIRNAEKGSRREASESRWSKPTSTTSSGTPKARVLNLNVPTCIGYRHHLSCKSDENSAIGMTNATTGSGSTGGNGGGGSGGGVNLFNLRSLFTKKSIVTSH